MNEKYPKSVEEVRRHFDFFDDDKNGFIDFEEFQDMLSIMGQKMTERESEESFAKIDANCDSRISFSEFIAWWQDVWYDD